jgi:SAM-dependent methyltransferase
VSNKPFQGLAEDGGISKNNQRYLLVIVSQLDLLLESRSNREVFTEVYVRGLWGALESRSGTGSNLEQTETIREQLPGLIRNLGARKVLDAPCGDFYWLKEVELDLDEYTGGDIVRELIEENRKRYESPGRKFIVLDIIEDELPRVDLIFCRDCLVHLSFRDISSALANMKKSRSTYFLTTTFSGRDSNEDIRTGQWRPLNLQRPPFDFPEPISLINENCTIANGIYADKCLGLWKLSELC